MSILYNYGLTDRFSNEATLYPDLAIARITSQHRGHYRIVCENGTMLAEISGKFRYETTDIVDYPTVGDFVMVSMQNSHSNAIIQKVLTRKSIFVRTAVGVSGQVQSVASNIDTVFICMSLNNNFNLSRLERYLSVAWDSGATPVVLLTKADLCNNLEEMVYEVERVSSFSDVVAISVYDEDIEQKLSKYLKEGSTSAFIGSSGVGKSTLINKLMHEEVLATSDIGKADKGRHTTTDREMFLLSTGGVLIDTPGMRELGVDSVDLERTFDDIEELASHCKFKNCTHTNEPECAILEALKNGTLEQRRFENYIKLKNEAGYDGLNAKQIEVKKLERITKDIGGMKNMRKFAKQQRNNKI